MPDNNPSFKDRLGGRERARIDAFLQSSDQGMINTTSDMGGTGSSHPKSSEKPAVFDKAGTSVNEAAIISSSSLENAKAKWIGLASVKYRDPSGRERLWESAYRKTKSADTVVDGVGIVAFLQYPPSHERGAQGTGPYIVLQKQFRPAVGKVCIEVPAGLVDAGETIETAALRELKEETGYVGAVIKSGTGELLPKSNFGVSMTMYNDPGFCTTSTQMVHVTVDMSLPENAHPKAELEDGEFIECFEVKLGKLWEECIKLEKEGFAIDARVGGLAEGIECARLFGGV